MLDNEDRLFSPDDTGSVFYGKLRPQRPVRISSVTRVINLAPDKRPVFAEAFRVLKPGGRISVSDIVTEGEFSDTAQWAECVIGAIDSTLYTGLIREAGFTDIQVVDKANAEGIIEVRPGMPRVFSARVTARKAL